MNNKFKAGDKVVALKGFHTIKVGDILTVDNAEDFWFQAVECRGFTLRADNYVLHKPTFKNMKFLVNSPEHSKEIQEALFEMGYKWSSQGAVVMFTYEPDLYLYGASDGRIFRSNNNWTDFQEHTVETTKSYNLIPVVSKPETITIDGKTYDKEAVLKRLTELEEGK